MRIVHFSDWHWEFAEHPEYERFHLPEADLYVCTGDMMDNYPVRDRTRDPWDIMGGSNWRISPKNEEIRQGQDAKHFAEEGGFRRLLGSPDAPVVCVRGNHDFIDLAGLFEGCNLVHEFRDNEVVEVLGKRISGHRGIPYIYGSWNDEVSKPDLMDRVRAIPEDIDLLLTHYPPSLILDAEVVGRKGGMACYGLEGMSGVVFNKMRPGGVHMFGHIHGSGGRTQVIDEGGDFKLTFSNAATKVNVIEV